MEEKVEQTPEETQVETEETQEETPTGPSLAEIQSQLSETQTALEDQKERYKDLSGRLTREQQEKAELYKFHRTVVPQINKSFAEKWEDNPETAVTSVIEERVQPNQMELERLKARQAETDILVRNPEYGKYRERVAELGNKYWQDTHSAEGIEKLYKLAENEDLKVQLKKLKSNGEAEAAKERAFTEESSSKPPPAPKKKKLSSAQMRVAENLGIPSEKYLERLEEVK